MDSDTPQVLVVDDDPTARDVSMRMLKRLGVLSAGAHDGEAAFQLVKAVPFAAVFLDWELPDSPGNVVAQRLRELKPELPIIGLSGYSPEDTNSTVFDLYLTKPVTTKDFARALKLVHVPLNSPF